MVIQSKRYLHFPVGNVGAVLTLCKKGHSRSKVYFFVDESYLFQQWHYWHWNTTPVCLSFDIIFILRRDHWFFKWNWMFNVDVFDLSLQGFLSDWNLCSSAEQNFSSAELSTAIFTDEPGADWLPFTQLYSLAESFFLLLRRLTAFIQNYPEFKEN